jgi:hypothetical protein
MGNPERDWGRPSWPTGGGGSGRKGPKITYHGGAKPPKKGSGSSGNSFIAFAALLVGTPALIILFIIGYLLHGNGVV